MCSCVHTLQKVTTKTEEGPIGRRHCGDTVATGTQVCRHSVPTVSSTVPSLKCHVYTCVIWNRCNGKAASEAWVACASGLRAFCLYNPFLSHVEKGALECFFRTELVQKSCMCDAVTWGGFASLRVCIRQRCRVALFTWIYSRSPVHAQYSLAVHQQLRVTTHSLTGNVMVELRLPLIARQNTGNVSSKA